MSYGNGKNVIKINPSKQEKEQLERYKKDTLKEIEELRLKSDKLRVEQKEKISSLECSIAVLKDEYSKNEADLSSISSQIKEAKDTLAKLQGDYAALQQKIAEGEAYFAKRKSDAAEYLGKVSAENDDKLNENVARIRELKNTIADLESKIPILSKELANLNAAREEIIAKTADAEIALNEASRELEKTNKDLSLAQDSIVAKKSQLVDLDNSIMSKQEKIAGLEKQISSLSAEIAQVNTDKEKNANRAAELMEWDNRLKVEDKALKSLRVELTRQQATLREAQANLK